MDYDEASATKRPMYLVAGKDIGEGHDGEPLLDPKTLEVIGLLDGNNIYNDYNSYAGYTYSGKQKEYPEEYKDGGSIHEHKEIYKKWKSLVNMSKSELEKFYNSQEGKEAGLTPSEAKEKGIDSGRESARWIMKMKDIPNSEWTPTMWDWAKKQISFISRMSGNKGPLYDDKGNKTRKHTSLLIWGHNPEKFKEGGSVIENNFEVIEIPIAKLVTYDWKLKEALQEIKEGKLSYSKDEPSIVSYLPHMKKYIIVDGHHRILQQMMEGKKSVPVILNEYQPKIWHIKESDMVGIKDIELPVKMLNGGEIKIIPINELVTYEDKLEKTIEDISEGKFSKSKDKPALVSYHEESKAFLIKDGNHRVIESVMEGQKDIPVIIKDKDYPATHNMTDGDLVNVTEAGIPTLKLGGPINKKFDLGKHHSPFIKVAKGGSCCANCIFIKKEENKYYCTNGLFVKWNGTNELPDNINEICSDWYLPKKS